MKNSTVKLQSCNGVDKFKIFFVVQSTIDIWKLSIATICTKTSRNDSNLHVLSCAKKQDWLWLD